MPTEPPYNRDLEETDEQLDSNEGDTFAFWEHKQRELITSTVDYNLGTLNELVDSRVISLTPQYQRRLRWDEIRQSRLIESFLMNVPVPPIFLNEDAYGVYSVIDGKQRLLAITDFLHGRLRLIGLNTFADINNLLYGELPLQLQAAIRTRPTLRAVIILRQSDGDLKYEVFHRLNTGGVHLNPQEVRNNAFSGPLNDTIMKLSEHKLFHRLLGIVVPTKSLIYREMRDAEFVLRYFTFRSKWQGFQNGMRNNMDGFMADNRNIAPAQLNELSNEFLNTLEVVEQVFGGHAFHRFHPERSQWRKQVLAALYDAQMFACQYFSKKEVFPHRDAIMTSWMAMFSNARFRFAIDAATNAPFSFKLRIEMTRDMIATAIANAR